MIEAISEVAEDLHEIYDKIDMAEAIINNEPVETCAHEARIVVGRLISLLAECRDQHLDKRVG